MSGSLEHRGNSFRVRLCVAGRRHSFTVRTTDRKTAEAAAAARLAELERAANRRSRGLIGEMSFAALVADFEAVELPTLAPGTRRSYRDALQPLRMFFEDMRGNPRISTIRRGDVRAYLSWRRVHPLRGEGEVSPYTVVKDRRVLHRLFTYAIELEYTETNPVAGVRPPKPDPRTPHILTDEEYGRLLAACSHDPMLHTYVTFLGETGTRALSEALRLRWEDVDLASGFVQIVSGRDGHRTKAGRSRWVPLTPRLRQALQEHFARFRFAAYDGKRSPWVFHHLSGRRSARPGDRLGCLRRGFRKACQEAGTPAGFRQHDLRHRRVTKWLAEGASPVLVKEAVGHSALATTMGYTHLAREHLRALVDDSSAKAVHAQQA